MKNVFEQITADAASAVSELIERAALKEGQLLVVGCSSSEVAGGLIGHDSSVPCAQAVYRGIAPILKERGIALCVQCCEHLNRAIIMERAAAETYGYEIVAVVPQPKAGGSFATVAYANMTDPVAVEEISAHAGIDIGGTLIGMHLRRVAVPLRLTTEKIGEARILCAYTRPKYIGGCRAFYEWDSSKEDLYRV